MRRRVIDDDTPTPPHARFHGRRLALVVGTCVALWLFTLAMLVARYGPGSHAAADGLVLHQGGAAHVRRRVRGAAVRLPGRGRDLRVAHAGADDRRSGARRDDAGTAHHGRRVRRLRRRMDAGSCSGPSRWRWPASRGACVATFFTFLPSFLFILAGGPLVESTHGQLRFTAPLSGITAAVVGVIVNLAVFFAWHVFWPKGWDGGAAGGGALGGLDAVALAIGVAAIRRVVPLQGRRDPGDPRVRRRGSRRAPCGSGVARVELKAKPGGIRRLPGSPGFR